MWTHKRYTLELFVPLWRLNDRYSIQIRISEVLGFPQPQSFITCNYLAFWQSVQRLTIVNKAVSVPKCPRNASVFGTLSYIVSLFIYYYLLSIHLFRQVPRLPLSAFVPNVIIHLIMVGALWISNGVQNSLVEYPLLCIIIIVQSTTVIASRLTATYLKIFVTFHGLEQFRTSVLHEIMFKPIFLWSSARSLWNKNIEAQREYNLFVADIYGSCGFTRFGMVEGCNQVNLAFIAGFSTVGPFHCWIPPLHACFLNKFRKLAVQILIMF